MTNKFHHDTISDISRRSASRYLDETAIIFQDKALTFSELEMEACRFVDLMLAHGIKKGDRVAITCTTRITMQ